MVLGKIWGIIVLISMIWVIVDVLPRKRKSLLYKVAWILIALFFGIFGALAYYIFSRYLRW